MKEQTVFNNVADAYAKWRPSYPLSLYTKVLEFSGVDRFGAALDIGCGAGHSTDGLKSISNIVYGLDIGQDLLAKARSRHPDVSFIHSKAEKMPFEKHTMDCITVGTAFYWMNREAVIAEIGRILKPSGTLAIYRYGFPWLSSRIGSETLNAFLELYWDQHRSEALKGSDNSAELIESTAIFEHVARFKHEYRPTISLEQYVGFLSSTSYVSQYLQSLPISQRPQFLDILKKALRCDVENSVQVILDLDVILAKR